jgi:hypothetical protein
MAEEGKMRIRQFGSALAVFVSIAGYARAQTPTPTPTFEPTVVFTPTSPPTPTHTSGPSPTPTPRLAYLYRSDYKLINTVTPNDQQRPSVAVGADGKALYVFHSDAAPANPGYFDIKGVLLDQNGNPASGEFQINQPVANHIAFTPQVAALNNGNYLVVWSLFNNTVTDANIIMRPLDASGNPLADSVQVNTFTTGKQRLPRTAADPSTADIYVAWESEGQDGNGYTVIVRKVDGDTWEFLTPEIQLNNQTAGNQDRVQIGADATGFTATWLDAVTGVEARRFDLNGNPLAPQFNVFPPGFVSPDVGPGEAPLHISTRTDGVFGRVGPGGDLGSIFRIYEPNPGAQVLYGGLCKGLPDLPPNVTWEEFVAIGAEYAVKSQSLEETSYGLREHFGPFEIFPGSTYPWIPTCARGANGEFFWGGQNFGGANDEVYGLIGGFPEAVEAQPFDDDNGNEIAEEEETVNVNFSLSNVGDVLYLFLGDLTAPASTAQVPAGGGLTINDATADYGSVAPGESTDCRDTGDCYSLTVTGPRPGLHWDEGVTETLNTGVHKTWLLHIGGSFADVSTSNLFYAFIENLLHNGITAGGACGGYCPTDGVKRQQMAVFLLKSRFGPSFVPPPATGTIFTDVPLANPFAASIETLFFLGVTGGCSGGPPPAPTQFCPDAIVNRQQMAVFLLKTVEGSAYLPPAATGIFQDLPPANPFAAWAEELYNRQITGGCVASPLQYCPTNPTKRQQMAAFLVKTFGLLLYGP